MFTTQASKCANSFGDDTGDQIMSDDITLLHVRLQSLEQRLRRTQRFALALVMASVIALLLGAAVVAPAALTARELRLVDDRGNCRLWLTLTREGHPKILLLDADGMPRVQLNSQNLTFEERGFRRAGFGDMGPEYRVDFYDPSGRRVAGPFKPE